MVWKFKRSGRLGRTRVSKSKISRSNYFKLQAAGRHLPSLSDVEGNIITADELTKLGEEKNSAEALDSQLPSISELKNIIEYS